MPVDGIITIVLVVVAIIVIAIFLIRIGTVLRAVSQSLGAVIGSVGEIPAKTAPIEPVLTAINKDLAIGRGVLEGLLAKKLGPPPPGSGPAAARYDLGAAAAPEPAAAEPDTIQY
ncbi:MAG: hypothetical protein M3Y17_13190, partial [Actinomycetota bacterium]|nr:hypothetical protein [Actinomycetota bacterium]